MNIEQLREFVALETRKKEIDAEKKRIAARLDELEEVLIPQFLENGMQRATVDGRTVYIRRDIRVRPAGDRQAVVDALKASDLEAYVKENYNDRSFEAYVREIAKDLQEQAESEDRILDEQGVIAALPESVGSAVKVLFIHTLSSQKA